MDGQNKLLGVLTFDTSQLSTDLQEARKMIRELTSGMDFNVNDAVRSQLNKFLKDFNEGLRNTTQTSKTTGNQLSHTFDSFRQEGDIVLRQLQRIDSELNVVSKSYTILNQKNGSRATVNTNGAGDITGATRSAEVESQRLSQINNLYRQRATLISELLQRNRQLLSAGEEEAQVVRDQIQATEQKLQANQQQINTTDEIYRNQERELQLRQQAVNVEQELTRLTAQQNDRSNARAKTEEQREINRLYREAINSLREMQDYERRASNANRAGDTVSAQGWTNRASASSANFDAQVAALRQIQGTETQIIQLENQRGLAVQKIADYERQNQQAAIQSRSAYDQILKTLQTMVTVAASRAISQMWKEAVTYARNYYDALNEIRVVTGQSQEEANALGEQYRQLAQEMSVSSTTLASGAVQFYRQGLGDDEVNERLRETVQFAKVAAIDFNQAIELITASTNGFGKSAQEVADTFIWLGDNAATSATEIAEAAQRSAASANAVGVDMQRLASYIATVSEVTRLSAQEIGTAFRGLFQRMQQIRTTGFNEDDDTQINDVAKALDAIGLTLMDTEGNFRAFDEVLQDVANVWDDLSDKERAYVQTSLAGQRQSLAFLTLMDNLKPSIDGVARATELYEGSLQAAGTTGEKYLIWQESVAAANERMKASLETLYATFLSGENIKGFYDLVSNVVNIVLEGTQALSGMNIVLPATLAGIGALVTGFMRFRAAADLAGGTLKLITKIPVAGWIGVAVAAIGAVTAISGAIARSQVTLEEATKAYSDSQAEWDKTSTTYQELANEYEELSKQTSLTTEENERLETILRELVQLSPSLQSAITDENGKLRDQATIVGELTGEFQKLREERNAQAMLQAADIFSGVASEMGNNRSFTDFFLGQGDVGTTEQGRLLESVQGVFNEWRKSQLTLEEFLASDLLRLEQFTNELRTLDNNDILNLPDFSAFSSYFDWDVNEYLEKQATSIELAYAQIESGTQQLTSNLDAIWAEYFVGTDAYVFNNSFDQLTPEVQGYVQTAYEEWKKGIDRTKTYTVQELTALALEAQQITVTAFDNQEAIDILVSQLNRLAEVDQTQLDPEGLAAWEAKVQDVLTALNQLLEMLGLPAFNFEAALTAAENTEVWTEELFELTEAQAKIISNAQGVVTSMKAEQAALNGYRTELNGFNEAVTDNNLLDYWSGLSEEIRSGMLKAYPELAKVIVALDDGELSAQEMADATEAVTSAFERMNREVSQANLADAFSDFKDVESTINDIDAALDKLAKKPNEFAATDLSGLISQYPELLLMMGNQAELEQYLIALKGEQAQAHAEAYASMLENSEGFYNYMISSNSDLYQQLAALYNGDVSNFTTLANAKAAIEQQLLDQLNAAWSGHFSSLADAFSKISSMVSGAQKDLAGLGNIVNMAPEGTASGDFYRRRQEMLQSQVDRGNSALKDMQALENALGNIGKGLEGISITAPSIGGIGGGSIGGGGGGGSSSTEKVISETERMISALERLLSTMEQLDSFRAFNREMNNLNAAYYKNRGELTNYISAMEDEIALVQQDTQVVEQNIRVIEEQMAQKRAEIASHAEGTEEYDGANEALKRLQDAHMNYSKQLLQNRNDVDELTRAIRDQQDAILQQQIDLRNLIESAIRDREELYESMLQAEISLENEILAIIRRRYEEERDMIIANVNERIAALNAEKKAIDDALAARRKSYDVEKKQNELAKLQAQYARIVADPTRSREALALEEQIRQLQEEMAWDLAEEEANAQKQAIDDQIMSLEDYIAHVQKYYEDLFKYPEKLIAEMRDILGRTDAEIIAWLQANDENYASSSARQQENMVRNWQNTLNGMRGEIVTYWDEVESIIAQGDQAIIDFLKANSAEYRAAGELQSQQYVTAWQRQLEALRAAAQQTYQQIQSYNYQPTYTGTNTGGSSSSGGSSSGGSSGGGGGSGGGTRYQFGYRNNTGAWRIANSSTNLQTAFQNAVSAATAHWNLFKGDPGVSEVLSILRKATASNPGSYIRRYAKGGLANYTGLAMLDGSPQNPEGILNPAQTKLFQSMVRSLEKVSVPEMPAFQTPTAGSGGVSVEIGSLNVSVDRLENEDDFETLMNRIDEAMYQRLNRQGFAAGGMFGR